MREFVENMQRNQIRIYFKKTNLNLISASLVLNCYLNKTMGSNWI